MKRIFFVLAALALLAISVQAQTTIADIARQERAKKLPRNPNTRVYTNESLNLKPVSDTTVSDAKIASNSDAKAAAGSDVKAGDAKDAAKQDDGKKLEEIRSQIAQQKQEITQIQREIDVAEREAKLRAAQYYGDAGAKLRDEKNYLEADRKAKADVAAKQQSLAQAQQKLAQLEEAARRAGVPAGQIQ